MTAYEFAQLVIGLNLAPYFIAALKGLGWLIVLSPYYLEVLAHLLGG